MFTHRNGDVVATAGVEPHETAVLETIQCQDLDCRSFQKGAVMILADQCRQGDRPGLGPDKTWPSRTVTQSGPAARKTTRHF